jgi:thymidine phosphorylase
MPRIIVTTDPVDRRVGVVDQGAGGTAVMLDERVHSVHLSDNHAAEQLIERLAWAVNDAEDRQSALTR